MLLASRPFKVLGIGLLVLVTATACLESSSSTDREVSKTVKSQQEIYTANQPLPVYEYSAPRQIMIELFNATVPELRPAWHVFSIDGVGYTDMCAGMGIPLPYSTQLTNPEYLADHSAAGGFVTLPQPEPDSLYKPDTDLATWVLCDYGNGLEPVYDEGNVRTFFHPVEVKEGEIIHHPEKPSIVISDKAQGKK
jgi:hypothetical protein